MPDEYSHRTRRPVRSRSVVALLAAAGLIASCGSNDGPVDIFGDTGWRGGLSDAHNSASVTTDGSRDLSLEWTRPLGAEIATRPSIAPNGQITASLAASGNCPLGSFQGETGRKRFCNGLGPAGVSSTPVADTASNLYAGEDGAVVSVNPNGQTRWLTPVYGVPRTPQFLPDGNLLAITQFGQVNVLSNQSGRPEAPILDLVPTPDPLAAPDTQLRAADDGLLACLAGGPACPVAAAPAVDLDASVVYVVLWREGAIAPQVVALRYTAGPTPSWSEEWSSDLLPTAVTSSPVLSPDGSRLYTTDVEGSVRAYDTSDGREVWTYFVGDRAAGSVTVAPDGTLVPSGGAGAVLRAIRDTGDAPEPAWERTDLVQAGAPAVAGSTVYAVTGTDELSLTTVDLATRETVDTDALPDAAGYSPGVVVGSDGAVVVPVGLGTLYSFR